MQLWHISDKASDKKIITAWCFQIFVRFTPIWGRFPFKQICFKGFKGGWNHQLDKMTLFFGSEIRLTSWYGKLVKIPLFVGLYTSRSGGLALGFHLPSTVAWLVVGSSHLPGEAIHDAAHFGHRAAVAELVKQKADPCLRSKLLMGHGPRIRTYESMEWVMVSNWTNLTKIVLRWGWFNHQLSN